MKLTEIKECERRRHAAVYAKQIELIRACIEGEVECQRVKVETLLSGYHPEIGDELTGHERARLARTIVNNALKVRRIEK